MFYLELTIRYPLIIQKTLPFGWVFFCFWKWIAVAGASDFLVDDAINSSLNIFSCKYSAFFYFCSTQMKTILSNYRSFRRSPNKAG